MQHVNKYVYLSDGVNHTQSSITTSFNVMDINFVSSGRKWNVEKNQVDIVPYRADRLFLGTLCFTILLFLLPTTAAYYVVFTALRLLVLFVKGIVGRVIDMMHNLPVFPLLIAFVRSDLIPGKYYYTIRC